MSKSVRGSVTPKLVSSYMSFDRDNSDWSYSSSSKSMADKQAEGVAHLWNTMAKHEVAILADEVGMGKTFQALGVASLLWKTKPNAKILVMAPNRDICAGWMNEYDVFLNKHYRDKDHLVRNVVDGAAVNAPVTGWSLKKLTKQIELKAGSFYFTTIHSLSGLVKDSENCDPIEEAKNQAKEYNAKIKEALDAKGFDLLIIDEAHYFRNVTGSQRASAARAFFGKGELKLAQKTLLLTATPTHSASDNIKNILSYFVSEEELEGSTPEKLLSKYALRRLRLMKGKGGSFHNKHSYRDEKVIGASFKDKPMAELFFALYQKKLVELEAVKSGGKSFLYGYLEGFESFSNEEQSSEKASENENTEEISNRSDDFNKAVDSEIIQNLTKDYRKLFNQFPEHPKYDALIEKLIPEDIFAYNQDLHNAKHLVFVRRLPSVRELTQRVNEKYDEIMRKKILAAWGLDKKPSKVKSWKKSDWNRDGFKEMIKALKPREDDGDVSDSEEDAGIDDSSIRLGSRVADLFVVKKKDKGGSTDCSNVRLRFIKPESMFSMFMEPPADYKSAPYVSCASTPPGEKAFYTRGLRAYRSKGLLGVQEVALDESFRKPIETAWGLMYDYLNPELRQKIQEWQEQDAGILENFSNYMKKGFLYASPVMVELYCWYTEFVLSKGERGQNKNKSAEEKYLRFITFVKKKIEQSLMLVYFKNALLTFEALCERISKSHQLNQYEKDWDEFTNLQSPAWFASGESSNRSRLILGFNSPFYPNTLVATSVFQEGVNLHLQCKNVHHYGIAWTAGDTEQRIGRVDRLFGKVNQLLVDHGDAELDIYYPYLENSFDQDQLSSFFVKKAEVDSKLDSCLPPNVDKTIELTSVDWLKLLRTKHRIDSDDPYPAKRLGGEKPFYAAFEEPKCDRVDSYIKNLLSSVLESGDTMHSICANTHNPNALFLIDPKLEREGERRKQPIIVEQHFSSEFSCLVNGTVYIVTLKTPLCSEGELTQPLLDAANKLYETYSSDFPLVQLVIDKSFSESNFYLHMKIDLPLFVHKEKHGMLSVEEVRMSFRQLKLFADMLEQDVFDRDLMKRNLKIAKHSHECLPCPTNLDDLAGDSLRNRWETVEVSTGTVAQLLVTVDQTMDERGALTFNSRYPFVKVSRGLNQTSTVTLSFPFTDFQTEEQVLLESWFDFVVKKTFDTMSSKLRNSHALTSGEDAG